MFCQGVFSLKIFKSEQSISLRQKQVVSKGIKQKRSYLYYKGFCSKESSSFEVRIFSGIGFYLFHYWHFDWPANCTMQFQRKFINKPRITIFRNLLQCNECVEEAFACVPVQIKNKIITIKVQERKTQTILLLMY